MQTTITLTIHHKKPIEDLSDKVAGRSYTIAGVDDVNAILHPCTPKEYLDLLDKGIFMAESLKGRIDGSIKYMEQK